MKRSASDFILRLALVPLAVFALGSLAVSSSSCTAIGYAIGNAISNRHPSRVVPAGTAFVASVGTPMALTLEDSTIVRGFYLGRARRDDAEYARALEAWHARTDGAPALEEAITLVWKNGREESAGFEGFAYRVVCVMAGRPAAHREVAFSKLRGIRMANGRTWTTDELAALDASGELPSREALLVGLGIPRDWKSRWSPGHGIAEGGMPGFRDTARVAVERVALAEVPSKGTARTVGTLVGFSADAVIVAGLAALASWRGPFDSGSGCDTSGLMYTRLAPPPTEHPFDTWAGTFVDDARPVTLPDETVAIR